MEYIRKQRWANYLIPKCKEYLINYLLLLTALIEEREVEEVD